MAKHTLYLSFDGLSDPLGQSQILPYLCGIARNGYSITVISCEKEKRLIQQKDKIETLFSELNINWRYLIYDETGGFFSRFKYSRQLYSFAAEECSKNKNGLVHCRSYLAALAGLKLKKKYGLAFIFDMRGLWADERRDGLIWSRYRPLHILMFWYFKRKEKQFLKKADQIVSLTQAGISALAKMYPSVQFQQKTTVIPCCTNTDSFDPAKTEAVALPQLTENTTLLVYTGSIGTWYMTKEMIDCAVQWQKKIPDLKLLILTNDQPQLKKILKDFPSPVNDLIITLSASHAQVPAYLKAASAAIFFIKPAFSKVASSPTKMAECWAMGLPVITNAGIGDNDLFFENGKGGVLVHGFDENAYDLALENYLHLDRSADKYRKIALEQFDAKMAVEKYTSIYNRAWQSDPK